MSSKKKNADRTYLFESMPVSKAVWTLCIPNILTMLAGVVYNMVDMYFIGKTRDPIQLAAVSLCGPIFTVLMGIGNIFGIGGSSLLSRSMGEGKMDFVKRIAAFCFWSALGIGIICGIVILGAMDPLLKVFGSDKDTYVYCRQYMTWMGFGAPIVVLNFVLSNLVRAEGRAKETMAGQMLGNVMNIIFDPIMIFGFKMGVVGAAAATILGQFCSVVYFAILVTKGKTQSINPKLYKITGAMIIPIAVIGIPSSVNNIMTSVASVLLNNNLVVYGNETVAGLGVAGKINSLGMMILIAIAFGVMPLLGYCYGAKNKKRFMAVIRYTALSQIAVGTVAFIIMELFATPMVRFFIDEASVIPYGVLVLRVMNASAPVLGLLFLSTNVFQSMGKGLPSMVLSLSRQGIIYIPLLLILANTMGYYGVIWAQPVADYVALAVGIGMFTYLYKKELAR